MQIVKSVVLDLIGLTTIIIVVSLAQKAELCVKVYVEEPEVVVFIVDGFHVPLIPFVDVVGSEVGVEF